MDIGTHCSPKESKQPQQAATASSETEELLMSSVYFCSRGLRTICFLMKVEMLLLTSREAQNAGMKCTNPALISPSLFSLSFCSRGSSNLYILKLLQFHSGSRCELWGYCSCQHKKNFSMSKVPAAPPHIDTLVAFPLAMGCLEDIFPVVLA